MRRRLRYALLFLVLSIASAFYKLTGRRFLELRLQPELDSYYEDLPDPGDPLDEY